MLYTLYQLKYISIEKYIKHGFLWGDVGVWMVLPLPQQVNI